MRDILDKYPIFVLRHELINVRTGYRLEKKKLTEILKTMKSIKKLEKEQIIDLLIKYNYDMSKLPKIEDIQKPKKPKESEPFSNTQNKNLSITYLEKFKNLKKEKDKLLKDTYTYLDITDVKPLFKKMLLILIRYINELGKNEIFKEVINKAKEHSKYLDQYDKKPLFKKMEKYFDYVDENISKTENKGQQPSIYDLYFKAFKEQLPTIEETNKIIDKLEASNDYKKKIKEITKIYFSKLINNYDDLKQKLLSNKEEWDNDFKIRSEKARKSTAITPSPIADYKFMDEKEYIEAIDKYVVNRLHDLFHLHIKYINKLYYDETIKEFFKREFNYYYNDLFNVGYAFNVINFISSYLIK